MVDCSSDPKKRPSFQEYTKRAGPYGAETTLLHRVRWPGPFVLGSVTLVQAGREDEYPLKFTCKPGGRFVVVVDEKGRVAVEEAK